MRTRSLHTRRTLVAAALATVVFSGSKSLASPADSPEITALSPAPSRSAMNSPVNTVYSEGVFVPADSMHFVKGSTRIEYREDGFYLIVDDSFATVAGPDLRFVLRSSENRQPMVIVAPLLGFRGIQQFKLYGLTLSMLEAYDEVVVYCAKFHVDFGIAKLSSPQHSAK